MDSFAADSGPSSSDPESRPEPVPDTVDEQAGADTECPAPADGPLRAELEQARALAEERLAMAQRTQADYENLKRRAERERGDLIQVVKVGLLGQLLPLVDDLELALEANPDPDPTAWLEGLRLIQGKVVSALEAMGLQPIVAIDQPFDPRFHEGVGQVPGQDGVVVTQVQKGYLLNGHVLRPARVLVGNGEATPADSIDKSASAMADRNGENDG